MRYTYIEKIDYLLNESNSNDICLEIIQDLNTVKRRIKNAINQLDGVESKAVKTELLDALNILGVK